MTLSDLIIFLAVLTIGVLVKNKIQVRYLKSKRDRQLRARQAEIQSVLDELGALLKNNATTLEVGNRVAVQALEELNRLDHDGSLKELIVDTQAFVEEWRASKIPA